MKQSFTSLTLIMKSLNKTSMKKTALLTFCSSIFLFSTHIKAQEVVAANTSNANKFESKNFSLVSSYIADGALDSSIGDNDKVTTDYKRSDYVANSVTLQGEEMIDYLSGRSGLSLKLGGNSFLGDLGGNTGKGKTFIKDLNLKSAKLFAGLSYNYFIDKAFSLNADIHFTSVSGADSLSDQVPRQSLGRYDRNLSFKSSIFEMQITGELYPLQAISTYGTPKLMPYIGTGFGFFHFNPKTQLNGEWYYLQPLHLEGQGFAEYPERSNYKLTQLYIPITFGVKYRINDNSIIGLNVMFRHTFTDYIDDASTTYINPVLFDKYLSPYASSIAKQLYYRGKSSPTPKTNNYRGYTGNDSYTSVFFSFTQLF